MQIATPIQIAEAIVEDAIRGQRCDTCDKPAHVTYRHNETDRAGNIFNYALCGPCESKRISEAKEERALVDGLRPQLIAIVAGWHQMDRHDAYEALQALSLEVLTA